MAWDVLENTVMSAFIFGLGQAAGLVPCEPIGVELLQQTPMDAFWDVLIAKAKFVRLIEFKRELNKSPKERLRFSVSARFWEWNLMRTWKFFSREVHWYVQRTNFNKWQSSVIVPYLDMESPEGDRDLARFVQETADALAGPGLSEPGVALRERLYAGARPILRFWADRCDDRRFAIRSKRSG